MLSLKTKIHPDLLHTLQEVYLTRLKVINKIDKKPQDISTLINDVNFYSNGRGHGVLSKLDSLFNLHSNYPNKQYDLFNTSLQDSMNLTLIKNGRSLIEQLKLTANDFKTKSDAFNNKELYKSTRGDLLMDYKVSTFYLNNYKLLIDIVNPIEDSISKLSNSIAINSNIETSMDSLSKFIKENNIKENEELVKKELYKLYEVKVNSTDNTNNRIQALNDLSNIVHFNNVLSTLSTNLMKLANDFRFLSSGPRSGIGEMVVPENEPGSSIMPGKVNPTQCESLSMVAAQVIGNTNAVTISTSTSIFEGNQFLPLIANNSVRSVRLLHDGLRSFRTKCLEGSSFIEDKIKEDYKNLSTKI